MTSRTPYGAIAAYAMGSGLLFCLVWPLFRPVAEDSFPVSHFPMFALGRATPVLSLSHVVGLTANGKREPVPPRFTANGTVMQAASSIQRAIARGDAALFCEQVAKRLTSSGEGDVRALEVVTSHFHAIEYFEGKTTPGERHVHAQCDVAPRSELNKP